MKNNGLDECLSAMKADFMNGKILSQKMTTIKYIAILWYALCIQQYSILKQPMTEALHTGVSVFSTLTLAVVVKVSGLYFILYVSQGLLHRPVQSLD